MRFAALRRLGLRKTAVGLAPFVRFFSATFLRLLERFSFFYRNRKNVAYSRNVMRHFGLENIGFFYFMYKKNCEMKRS
jgi:hypothetical protein